MVIKFDHISYVLDKRKKQDVLNSLGEPVFSEIDLENISIKKQLMHSFFDSHDLYFFEGDYPTEYIFYDEVNGVSTIQKEDNVIYGSYSDIEQAKAFLTALFGKKVSEDGELLKCNMKGVLDSRDYPLVLEYSDNLAEPYLDDEGYGIVTVLVNSEPKSFPDGCIYTQKEALVVNGKQLEICFAKSLYTNIIFEIIKIAQN